MTEPASKAVEDVQALLDIVDLESIDVYEVRARAMTRGPEFDEGFLIKAAIDFRPNQMRTRFMMTFNATEAEYYVDLASVYVLEVEVEVPQAIAVEFTERVGIMSAYPFLREQIFGLATRLGQPVPVLGLLRAGTFGLSVDPPADTSAIEIPEG